jgi:hypothetical protein
LSMMQYKRTRDCEMVPDLSNTASYIAVVVAAVHYISVVDSQTVGIFAGFIHRESTSEVRTVVHVTVDVERCEIAIRCSLLSPVDAARVTCWTRQYYRVTL